MRACACVCARACVCMYVYLDLGVTPLQDAESRCAAVGFGVTLAVTAPLQPLQPMGRPNLVRDRFLAELEDWLTPSLMYHCFTGENDPYRLAHVEQLQPALQEPLLNKAERTWPARLQRIAADRKAEQQHSKALVRSYTQSRLFP